MKGHDWRKEAVPLSGDLLEWLRQQAIKNGQQEQFARTAFCYLCEHPAVLTGLYPMDERTSAIHGAVPGKYRTYVYGLCAGCADLDDVVEQVEDKIFAEMGNVPGRVQ